MVATFILLGFMLSGLIIALVKHGEPRDKYNFWEELISVIIALILYYYAGLFDKFSVLL